MSAEHSVLWFGAFRLTINSHYHKHQGLDPSIRSVSTVTTAPSNASSVFQLFSFLVVCSGMISKGCLEALRLATTKLTQRGIGYPSSGHPTQLRISRRSTGLIYTKLIIIIINSMSLICRQYSHKPNYTDRRGT